MTNPIAALIAQARHALVGGAEGVNPSASFALGGWEYALIPLGIIAVVFVARRRRVPPRGAADLREPLSAAQNACARAAAAAALSAAAIASRSTSFGVATSTRKRSSASIRRSHA